MEKDGTTEVNREGGRLDLFAILHINNFADLIRGGTMHKQGVRIQRLALADVSTSAVVIGKAVQ